MKKGIAALLACLLLYCLSPASYAWEGNVFVSKSNEDKQIALTFDDGPHPGRTPEILDILKEYEIHATFFVVGENAALYPGLIRREIEEGHEVANHTQSHTILKDLNPSEVKKELEKFEETLLEICDYRPRLIRPPGGLYNTNLCDYADENDYTVVLWSVDTRDWAHRSVADIKKTVLDQIAGGDIVLFHDYISGKSPTPQALQEIIPALIEEGYSFVTVSELLEGT